MSKTPEELNQTHAIELNGVVYPKGALAVLNAVQQPGHSNPNRLRNKRERQNRRKGRR